MTHICHYVFYKFLHFPFRSFRLFHCRMGILKDMCFLIGFGLGSLVAPQIVNSIENNLKEEPLSLLLSILNTETLFLCVGTEETIVTFWTSLGTQEIDNKRAQWLLGLTHLASSHTTQSSIPLSPQQFSSVGGVSEDCPAINGFLLAWMKFKHFPTALPQ